MVNLFLYDKPAIRYILIIFIQVLLSIHWYAFIYSFILSSTSIKIIRDATLIGRRNFYS